MSTDGFVALHRKLLTSEIFQNEKLLKIFIYCLLKASHSERDQKVGRQTVHLLPGQFVFGRKKAAMELDMKESTVRDYINLLKNEGSIDIKATNKYSVVSVVNWGVYQTDKRKPDSKSNNISDNKTPTNGQQINTNNNVNNVNNVNKDIQQQKPVDIGDNWIYVYEMNYGQPTMSVIHLMNSYLDDGMDQKLLSYAIEKASENGQKFNYAKGIINKWISKGILTYEAALAEEEEFNKRKVERIHATKRPQTNRPTPNIKGTDISTLDFSKSRSSL